MDKRRQKKLKKNDHPKRTLAKPVTTIRNSSGGTTNTTSSWFSRIPSDIIPNVLNKLPLETLCRFKTVSKTCHSLTLENYHANRRRPIFVQTIDYDPETGEPLVCIYSIDGTTRVATRITVFSYTQFCNSFEHFKGLYFFHNRDKNCLGVSNPRTQEVRLLPTGKYPMSISRCQLVFDPLSNKYKMLSWGHGQYFYVEIFTLWSGLWRVVSSHPLDPYDLFHSSCRANIHRTLYWYRATVNRVTTFHLGDEQFGVINGPKRLASGCGDVMHLFEYEGCVCLADHQTHLHTMDLWMLKDGRSNWVTIASIILPLGHMTCICPYPTRTGEVLLACKHDDSGNIQTLYLYSFITQQLDTLQLSGEPSDFHVPNYVENSVCLKDL